MSSQTPSRFVDFKVVKAAVSMEQVLAHYGLSGRFDQGKDCVVGACPIRREKGEPQVLMRVAGNKWRCSGECACAGDVLDFVCKMENVEPVEAANRMVEWFGLERARLNAERDRDRPATSPEQGQRRLPESQASERETPLPSAAPPPPRASRPARPSREEHGPNKPLGFKLDLDPSHPYLAERGISPEAIAEFGLGYCSKGIMAQRIAIPIKNAKAELVGYAGRWAGVPPEGKPRYLLPDGFKQSVEIYRLAEALREPAEHPLVIVEGFFDAIRLWQLGVRKCVALMGSSLSMAQEALLAEHLSPKSQVIVMLVQDDAGCLGRDWVLQRLSLRSYVRVVTFAEHGFRPEKLSAEDAQRLQLV